MFYIIKNSHSVLCHDDSPVISQRFWAISFTNSYLMFILIALAMILQFSG